MDFDIGLKHLIDRHKFVDSKNMLPGVSKSINDTSVFVVDDVNISLLRAISLLAKNYANKLVLVDPIT